MKQYAAGVDFGSDSVRCVLTDAADGRTIGEGVALYPRWAKKMYCEPERHLFRQHPLDYIEAFTAAFRDMLHSAADQGKSTEEIASETAAIGFDCTGSTPAPVDRNGTPLALLPEFAENPNAMFHLWKDHTAVEEAKKINRVLSDGPVDYTKFQGIYQSEWFWAKVLHTTRLDPAVRSAAYTWVEHCDWMPALLTGRTNPDTMYHCTCAAGHKLLWNSEFGGLPDRETLARLDPYLALVHDRYPAGGPQVSTSVVGTISREWAEKLGLPEDVLIAGSSLDAHAGGIGAGLGLHTLVKVVGTSAVDMTVEEREKMAGADVKTVLGLAEDSIIPGYLGVEAGMAAFGDVYAWLRETLIWPVREILKDEAAVQKLEDTLLREMEARIDDAKLDDRLIAIDWFNGRRYPVLNERARGALVGLTLGTGVPELYRALILSTLFGSRRMFEGFLHSGITVDRIIVVGGIAKKSPYIMQLMSDLLNRPIMVAKETQMCAKGSAMFAACAAGFYPDLPSAQKVYCEPYHENYVPNPVNAARYEPLYRRYLETAAFMDSQ